MSTILFDFTPKQRRRWLIRNSPAIPLAIAIILVCNMVDDLPIRLGTLAFGGICLGIMFWGAFFKRLLIDKAARQVTCQYRFLGAFSTREINRSIADCSHVQYSAYHRPYGTGLAWFGAIYLHFHDGKPWRIFDNGNFDMDLDCDEAMAQQLADALAIPLQKDQHDPRL